LPTLPELLDSHPRNSDGQQFHQYQQNKRNFKVLLNNSTYINKIKEILNSDGQQFHQYQQNKIKVPFFCFIDIDVIVDHHCLNFLLLC
jgi:hypothetical protein